MQAEKEEEEAIEEKRYNFTSTSVHLPCLLFAARAEVVRTLARGHWSALQPRSRLQIVKHGEMIRV